MTTISSDTLKGISWLPNWETKRGSAINIWRLKIQENIRFENLFCESLSQDELEKASRFRKPDDRARFIYGRGLLRFLLGFFMDRRPEHVVLEMEPNKKPRLGSVHDQTLHFNVSHSGNWVLVVIANAPVGIDIEMVDNSFTYSDLLAANFSNAEAAMITQSAMPAEVFFTFWTRKEALVKATGAGINDDLRLLPVINGTWDSGNPIIGQEQSWQIHSFNIDGAYQASVSCPAGDAELIFHDVLPSTLYPHTV
ncbi:MAG TPA: 4'-phosphopantetheinyl transferase superfamily protein [Puia sp.]|nr:4'-phosphopantetheinyl transferase superfamily protein [Puia sp.]